jgi:hypothetical protein
MMPDGLQVGIAAWMGGRRGTDDFVVWPAMPVPASLNGIEAVASMSDLARAAEFAYLVNFVPRKGHYAEPFGPDGSLWEIHRNLLQRMSFAARTWTDEEEAERNAASARLYEQGPDGPRMTRAYQRYEECRAAYKDLQTSRADPDELAKAFAEWVVNGKVEIEVAIDTLARLAQRSSLPLADEQKARLDPTLLAASADGSYAVTEFAPLTAVRSETWLSVEVTFNDLEQAIGVGPREKWAAWRANRAGAEGTVRFRFAALDLRRSWFSQTIYAADDWRIDGEPISIGDGINGRLPAVVSSVYMAIVDEIKSIPRPKPEPGRSPPMVVPPHKPDILFVEGRGSSVIDSRPRLRFPRPSAVSTVLRTGVVPTRPIEPHLASNAVLLRPNRLGEVIRPQRNVLLADRLTLAGSIASGSTVSLTPAPADQAFVVGFGCTVLPSAPRPNPGYQWPHN